MLVDPSPLVAKESMEDDDTVKPTGPVYLIILNIFPIDLIEMG